MKQAVGMVILASVMVLTSGCTTDPPPSDPPGPANVRVANAEIGALAFDVCADGQVVLENSRFGAITAYAEVDSGSIEFSKAAAGSACDDFINDFFGGSASIQLGEDSDNTLVLLADGESGFQLVDDNSPTAADRARVRLINASEDSLSLTVSYEGGGGINLFRLVRYNEPGDYNYVDVVASTYNLIVTPQAGEMTPIEFDAVELAAGTVYTLFAVGRIDGVGEGFDLIVSEDAVPGIED